MLDPKIIREQPDTLREGMRRRGKLDSLAQLIDDAIGHDRERRAIIQLVEEDKAARNLISQEVGKLKRDKQDATAQQEKARILGDEIASNEAVLANYEKGLLNILLEIPNITLPDVPEGGEENNIIVHSWGTPRIIGGDVVGGFVGCATSVSPTKPPTISPTQEISNAQPLPHWELAEKLGMLDLPRGAKISGSGFIVYRGIGAKLVRAMMNMMLDVHTRDHGYEEVWVPVVVNRATMTGTGQLPKFEEDMYGLRDEDMFLIPTAEVPVTNLYRDEILDANQIPRGFAAYSPCFRREAGSHGKDTRGLLRVHQFDKVELVRYSTPEDSAAQHELITAHSEKILQMLELPYRVKLLAAGDTGFSSAKTYDLEVYSPGVGTWLEVSSSSNFLDFQARRANIRYRPAESGGANSKPRFVHTLNASGVAFPRVMAALLEHHQDRGGVHIPVALQPYLGTARIG